MSLAIESFGFKSVWFVGSVRGDAREPFVVGSLLSEDGADAKHDEETPIHILGNVASLTASRELSPVVLPPVLLVEHVLEVVVTFMVKHCQSDQEEDLELVSGSTTVEDSTEGKEHLSVSKKLDDGFSSSKDNCVSFLDAFNQAISVI